MHFPTLKVLFLLILVASIQNQLLAKGIPSNHSAIQKSRSAPTSDLLNGSGFIVIAQGLISAPITLEFDDAGITDKLTPDITVSIISSSGQLFYSASQQTPMLDFHDLLLPAGSYLLEIQVGDAVKKVDFVKD